jgi:hypothetical protein
MEKSNYKHWDSKSTTAAKKLQANMTSMPTQKPKQDLIHQNPTLLKSWHKYTILVLEYTYLYIISHNKHEIFTV